MTSIRKIILINLLLATSTITTNAFAACSSGACIGKIDQLYVNASGVLIQTDGNELSLNCTAVSNVFITLRLDHPNYNAIYSGLLAAQYGAKDVRIRITEGSNDCRVAYISTDSQ